MHQLELDLGMPVNPLVAKAENGDLYRLQLAPKGEKLCEGCAFTTDSCMKVMKNDSCATELDGCGVWKLISQA